MSSQREACLNRLKATAGVPVVFIQKKDIDSFVVPTHPLPECFDFLSCVHKSDYLRVYLLYHFGGGYCDIKSIKHGWQDSFRLLNSRSDCIGCGYQEIGEGGVGTIKIDEEFSRKSIENFNCSLRKNYRNLIGNGAYIFKPKNKLLGYVLAEQERRILKFSLKLRENPGNPMGNNDGYPIKWTYLLGDIFQPLSYFFSNQILQDERIKPSFQNYR